MEVYIEYVILDNLIINYLILSLTKKCLNLKIKKLNFVCCNLFATLMAILMPLVSMGRITLFFFKITVACLMVLILKKPKNVKHFFITLLTFLSLTFAMGGFVYGMALALNLKTTTSGVVIRGYEIPMSILVVIFAFFVWLNFKLIASLKKQNKLNEFMYEAVLKVNGNKYHLMAFLDSGNSLYVNNTPIVVISAKTFLNIFKNVSYEKLLLGKIDESEIKGAEYLNVAAVGQSSKMLVFSADNLEILSSKNGGIQSQNFNNVKVGLAMKNFNKNFDVILHRDLMGEVL